MTIFIYIAIGTLLTGSIILITILARRGGLSFPWLQFYIRGKEEGFRISEINDLQRLVVGTKLRAPLSVYWSQKAMLACVSYVDRTYKEQGKLENSAEARFMRKLYDLLNRLTQNTQKKKHGLWSTRELEANMPLEIIYNKNRHKSQVVNVHSRYLAIAHPRTLQHNDNIQFAPLATITIKFWKQGDSGYQFDSRLLTEYDENLAILHIQHTRKINRLQMRNVGRKEINKPGELYVLSNIRYSHEGKEEHAGLRCQVIDLAEGGASVIVGGRASNQVGFKVQTRVNGILIALVTRLVSSEYHKEQNISLLRLKAINGGVVMRNRISALFYNINILPDIEQEIIDNTTSK